MRKRDFLKIFFIATFIVFLSFAGCFFVDRILEESKVQATAGAESATVDVSSFGQLKEEAEGGTKSIRITSDIVSTDTIFVPGDTTIYVDASHTITRHEDFLGDMFVIGTDKDDKNPIVETGKASKLTLKTNNGAKLFIDGNETNVTGTVCGTAFMTVNTAEFNTYDGVVIQNHKKLGNERTLKYRVSYPTEIGGAAVIITSGSYNMYGGEILNCGTNEDEDTTDVSAQGGAIYNFGQFNMYGGKIQGCFASRGGALYNYKIAKIFAGELLQNSATVYGGAVYNPNSQYSNLNIGDYGTDIKVNISSNTTEGSGGAIFSSVAASVFVPGSTRFAYNTAGSNGGAINSPGANIIKNTVFEENEAESKGGALYVYHNKATATVRHTVLDNVTFIKNTSASGGGAIGTGSSTSDYAYPGSTVFVNNCKFSQNQSKQGGAVYVIRQCFVKIYNCEMIENKATQYGGAIYITGKSTMIIEKTKANENDATSSGGFLYLTTGGTTVKIIGGEALDNTAPESKGSTIWTNATAVVLQIKGTTTKQYFNYNGEILGKGEVVEYEA